VCGTSRLRRFGLPLCVVAAGVLIPASPASAVAQSFVATLVGTQEFPSNGSTATGNGTVNLNAAETQITINACFTGLTSNATAGHIHAHNPPAPAPPGTNAAVRFGFAGVPAATSGCIPQQIFAVTPAEVLKLRTGQWYFNIHSTTFPGGEIRGQVVTSASYPATAAGIGLNTTWNLRNALTTGAATNTFAYGTRPNVPLFCDLNGDGNETPVSYEAGSFKVRAATPTGLPDTTITFGDPRGYPVAGDFDGDALDDVAVYRNGTWNVRYTDDAATATFSFGPGGNWPNTVPVSGDWNGDGIDGIGTYTYSTATWNLRQTATTGIADVGTFIYGTANTTYPVVGDWDLDNDETVGVRAIGGTTWLLRNFNDAGVANTTFDFGVANALPLSWRGAAP
jgi:hypothetical protein